MPFIKTTMISEPEPSIVSGLLIRTWDISSWRAYRMDIAPFSARWHRGHDGKGGDRWMACITSGSASASWCVQVVFTVVKVAF